MARHRKTPPRHATLNDDLARLRKDALKAPGVEDLMRLYGQYREVVERVDTYLHHEGLLVGFATSDRTA
ncbi:MAG: hypothetical protein HY704_16480 [Gemmatimonadetes bacterium]|nr:hypothetical protein [Gemmatimonadota bacterium]